MKEIRKMNQKKSCVHEYGKINKLLNILNNVKIS